MIDFTLSEALVLLRYRPRISDRDRSRVRCDRSLDVGRHSVSGQLLEIELGGNEEDRKRAQKSRPEKATHASQDSPSQKVTFWGHRLPVRKTDRTEASLLGHRSYRMSRSSRQAVLSGLTVRVFRCAEVGALHAGASELPSSLRCRRR
jgi:hypothetical protein